MLLLCRRSVYHLSSLIFLFSTLKPSSFPSESGTPDFLRGFTRLFARVYWIFPEGVPDLRRGQTWFCEDRRSKIKFAFRSSRLEVRDSEVSLECHLKSRLILQYICTLKQPKWQVTGPYKYFSVHLSAVRPWQKAGLRGQPGFSVS